MKFISISIPKLWSFMWM